LYITEEELEQLCKHASRQNRNRDRAAFRLAFEQGLRRQEICNGEWTHVDLKERVYKAVRLKNSNTTLHPMSDKCVALLKAWKKEQTELYGPCRYIFTTRQHNKMSPSTIWYAIKKAGEKAGIEIPLTTHMLKHSLGHHVAKVSNGNILEVKRLLGHKNVRNSFRYCEGYASDIRYF
jgi:integrase